MKMTIFATLTLLIFLTSPAQAKKRIHLDMKYNSSSNDTASAKDTVAEGERIERQFGRGDIDTVISMTPTFETAKGKKVIMVDVSIQNFRDGDLISESNPQIKTLPGKTAKISIEDPDLDEKYNLSIKAKAL